MKTKIWIALVASILLNSCVQSRDSNIQLLDINVVLSEIEAGKAKIWEIDRRTLIDAVFMDTEIKKRIDLIEPKFLLDIDMSLYERDENDKFVVKLDRSYQNATSVITSSDKNFIGLMRDRFGIPNPMQVVDGQVLSYKNKAFVTFDGYSFTLELKEEDIILVTIVSMVIE